MAFCAFPSFSQSLQSNVADLPEKIATDEEEPERLIPLLADSAFMVVREPAEILSSLPYDSDYRANFNPFRLPNTFVGFRWIRERAPFRTTLWKEKVNLGQVLTAPELLETLTVTEEGDTITSVERVYASPILFPQDEPLSRLAIQQKLYSSALDTQYEYMMANPGEIDGAYWLLHKAPELLSADSTFYVMMDEHSGFRFKKPEFPVYEMEKRHWLHVFNTGIQLSQAYLSPNWYQGGNNHLSFMFNFLWDVQLNQAYHPNTMFQNTVSYKLALNSNPKEQYHRYSISQDLFQWNMRTGFRAWKKWFYSLTTQFKTQFLNNYESDSDVRTASFLSSGDLNVGVGMTYSTTNKKKTFQLNISLAPLSYNLKMCIDSQVNPALFGIPEGKKTKSEIGSNGEMTINWKISDSISYRSRLFLFSDYKYFLSDFENTFDFSINRFLSTQIYFHLRYDSSTPLNPDWNHFMLKEILSFGFSYSFSTK